MKLDHRIIQVTWIPGFVAEQIVPEKNQALISILEPEGMGFKKNVNLHPDWPAILQLRFYDFDDISGFDESGFDESGLFNEEHAMQILRWLAGLPVKVDTIIIHCNAGISRSAAVAKYLSEIYGTFFQAGIHFITSVFMIY